MSFFRHGEIYRSDVVFKTIFTWGPGAASRWSAPEPSIRTRRKVRALLIVRDEFPAGYSLAGCSPAEPASASPTTLSMRWGISAGNRLPANGNLSLVSVSQHRGSVQRDSRNSRNPDAGSATFFAVPRARARGRAGLRGDGILTGCCAGGSILFHRRPGSGRSRRR
jgi:hypothetical protein